MAGRANGQGLAMPFAHKDFPLVIVQESCALGCISDFGLFCRQHKSQLFLEEYCQVLFEPLRVLPAANNSNQEVIGIADILQGLIADFPKRMRWEISLFCPHLPEYPRTFFLFLCTQRIPDLIVFGLISEDSACHITMGWVHSPCWSAEFLLIFLHILIQLVQIDIGEDGTDARPCGVPV